MDISRIKQLIDDGKIEYVKIGAPDIEGVYRGKRVDARYFLNSLEDGFGQCDVLFGWDIAEVVLPNLKFSNWEHGFADIVMKPDLSTFELVPWEENVASCVCDLWTEHGDPVAISPRYVLRKVIERARAMGYESLAAAELEFRFFARIGEFPYLLARIDIEGGDVFLELARGAEVEKDLALGDDGAAVSFAGGFFPENLERLFPRLDDFARAAVAFWAEPLRPIVGECDGCGEQKDAECQNGAHRKIPLLS